MRHLAVAITKNRKLPAPIRMRNGKLRLTRLDGDEFKGECELYAKLHEARGDVVETLLLPTPGVGALKALCGHLALFDGDLDVLAIFHHGTPKGLPGFGWNKSNIGAMADRIARAAGNQITILLYACLTGRGCYWFDKGGRNTGERTRHLPAVDYREGFAMLLCADLYRRGVQATVYGHQTSGHTTANPYKVVCEAAEVMGPDPVVQVTKYKLDRPGSPTWDAWKERLEDEAGKDDRLDFWVPATKCPDDFIPGASER